MGSARYRRIVLKLSGEALQGEGQGLDPAVLERVAGEIAEVMELGVEVAVVVGGGNIFRGLSRAAAGMERTRADLMGMLGTVINAIALQDGLERCGIKARAMSALPMDSVCDLYVRRHADALLRAKTVVIVGAGTGNPYFTTDTAGALRAAELQADVVMKATKVDGVYDRDPQRYPDAVRFERLGYDDVLRRGLAVMDATAITLCRDSQIPIVVFNMLTRGNIRRVVQGEAVGTVVGASLEDAADASGPARR